jgi:hypothetical protein
MKNVFQIREAKIVDDLQWLILGMYISDLIINKPVH